MGHAGGDCHQRYSHRLRALLPAYEGQPRKAIRGKPPRLPSQGISTRLNRYFGNGRSVRAREMERNEMKRNKSTDLESNRQLFVAFTKPVLKSGSRMCIY